MVRGRGPWLTLLLASLAGCSDDAGGVGTTQELTGALASASAGEVVRLRSGEFRGSFEVPAGVTLQGASGTVLIAEGGAALRLASGGNLATQIRDLTVETTAGTGLVGVLAGGDGDVLLDGVTVRAASGMGIAAEGPARLTLTGCDVIGTVTDELLAAASSDTFDPAEVAVAGLVVVGVAGHLTTVAIDDLEIRDTAGFGAVFAGVEGDWTGGRVAGVAGTGVLAEASSMRLAGVAIHDVRKSPVLGALDLAFGLVISAGSQVETEGLQVVRVDGFGVLQDASVGTHVGARIIANEGPGLWIQNAAPDGEPADLTLTESVLQGNGGVGVQLLDIRRAELTRTLIADTLGRPAISGTTDFRVVSDAVQVSATADAELLIADAALFGNGRVGLLLDGEGTEAASTGPVSICGNTLVGDEWDCQVEEPGVQTCLRRSGPIVGPDWTCGDGPDGTTCTTDAPASSDAEPVSAAVVADDVLPESESCRAGVVRVIDDFGLVPGLGLLDELAEAPVTPLDGPEWECANDGAARTCVDRHAGERIRVDDRDNPSRVDGPGWDCEDTADGRRCSFSGNGLLARAGAANDVTETEVDPAVAQRDASTIAAGAQETDAFGVHTALPTVCAGSEACVGVAGRGVLGEATLVGEDGLVSPQGAVEAVLGQAGFEPR